MLKDSVERTRRPKALFAGIRPARVSYKYMGFQSGAFGTSHRHWWR